jgi:hypothetical protein
MVLHRNKKDMPVFFSDNPELFHGFRSFCVENHHILTAESVQDYLITQGLPAFGAINCIF